MFVPLSGRINIGSIRAIGMAVFAIFMLSAGIAHARFLFWPQYTFWPGHYAPSKHKHRHRQTNSESAKNAGAKDAHSRSSSRSQTNGSRFLTTGP
jgi:hypothetical protein